MQKYGRHGLSVKHLKMKVMEPKVYVEERLESQRKWYSKKSGVNKNYHYWFKLLTIIFSILITVILGLEEQVGLGGLSTGIAASLGALVAILTAISGLMKFEEKWINYRGCSEKLKRERYLFETATAPYDKADALKVLVLKVENIISSENADWGDYIRNEEDNP
jgi:hypothetical protein